MWGRVILVAVASSVLAVGVLAGGCGEHVSDWGRNCTAEELVEYGCDYCPVTCARFDGGVDAAVDGDAGEDAAAKCDGQCMFYPAPNWLGPLLLGRGPEGEVPPCPEQAKAAVEWHADLIAPPAPCGACSCDPPVGSCTLPTSLTTSSSICPGSASGSAHFFFDAPAGWGGACTSLNQIPAHEKCGSSDCVASITIAPLNLTDGPCTVVTGASPGPLAKPFWGSSARTCQGTPPSGPSGCGDSSLVCVPAVAPGFAQCIYQKGDTSCPQGPFPYVERVVLYEDYADARDCAPCTCGDTIGSSCTAKVSLFTDQACSDLLGTFSISSAGAPCFDIQPVGSALGSKSAGPVTYNPGVCQSGGGEPIGAAEPRQPTTFCCLPAM